MSDSFSNLVTQAFLRLRRSGFNLGLEEYFAALELVVGESEFSANESSLKQALKLLWCDSRSEQAQFDPLWEEVLSQIAARTSVVEEVLDDRSDSHRPDMGGFSAPQSSGLDEQPSLAEERQPVERQEGIAELSAQPIRAPFTPAEIDNPMQLESYWPVSRRSMSYGWRYLRRSRVEGPAVSLDIEATVRQATEQGFYLAPVMRQREFNRAQLLLLLDQNGSMVPFHRFCRDLVETAIYDSSLQDEQVTARYFHNAPVDYLYRDAFLTELVALDEVLADCSNDTSVLIVSDAGAARGFRRLERIQAVTRFLMGLRRRTSLVAWLNPMPIERWESSSAAILANLVPMFQMDDDGLGNAIDVVRGQPLQHLRSPLL